MCYRQGVSHNIAQNAEKLISEKYNINAIARELVDLYGQLEVK